MHELGIALEIVDLAVGRAAGAPVRAILVEVGALALVLPDALRFAFEAVTEGTLAQGATLDLVNVPGRGRCRDCDGDVELWAPLTPCTCGSLSVDWLSGEQVRVLKMEVADVRNVRLLES